MQKTSSLPSGFGINDKQKRNGSKHDLCIVSFLLHIQSPFRNTRHPYRILNGHRIQSYKLEQVSNGKLRYMQYPGYYCRITEEKNTRGRRVGDGERTKKLITGEKVFLDWKRGRYNPLTMKTDTGMVTHMTNCRFEVRNRQRR